MAHCCKMAGAVGAGIVLFLSMPVFSATQGGAASVTPNAVPNNAPQGNVPAGGSPYGSAAPENMNPSANMNNTASNAAANNRRMDWDEERQYWREHYSAMPYYHSNADYSMYEPAYQYGFNLSQQNGGQPWERLNQRLLREGWERSRGNSNLSWEQAQDAVRDAYMRAYNNRNAQVSPPPSMR